MFSHYITVELAENNTETYRLSELPSILFGLPQTVNIETHSQIYAELNA